MSSYVTLLGADDVSRAAGRMQSAAEEMQRAASNMDAVLERHQRFLDDWLQRFEAALSTHDPEKPVRRLERAGEIRHVGIDRYALTSGATG